MNHLFMQKERLPLGVLFLSGVLTGIVMMGFGKSILLENTGLLDEYTLYRMKYMTVDSSAFFCYILSLRIKTAVILVVLATTYLGLLVCAGTAFWYGLSAGSFAAAVVIRYGLKGILLAFVGVMPQYLIYVPAMTALLFWCEKLNRSIYFRKKYLRQEDRDISWLKRIGGLAVIFSALLLGCLLESFVNPGLLEKLLKIF